MTLAGCRPTTNDLPMSFKRGFAHFARDN